MIHYIINTLLLSLLLTFVYYSLFRNSKNFLLRRFLVISIPFWSFLIPFSHILFNFNKQVTASVIVTTLNVIEVGNQKIVQASTNFPYSNLLWGIYLLVSFVLFIRLIMQISSIYQLKRNAIYKDGIYYTQSQQQVFSFFQFIFIPKSQTENLNYIIKHEKIHIAQKHSIDIIYFEILKIIFWFNPAFYFLKKELSNLHEFFVDDVILKDNTELEDYCNALIQKNNLKYIAIGNNFKQSQIKKRVIMMTKNKTKKWTMLRATGMAAVLLISTFVFANTKSNINLSSKQSINFAVIDSVYDFITIDKKPEFPGGMGELVPYLVKNIHYPDILKEKGVGGKVFVEFVINKKGKVTNVKIKKPVNPLLDAEAIRVISLMPDWTPGEIKSKKVSVRYIIPINFRSKTEKKDTKEE